VDGGRLTLQGKAATIEDAFLDSKSPRGSGNNTPARSRLGTPVASVNGTPVGSGAEDSGGAAGIKPVVRKKKKMTRNQMKAQEERRRLRKLHWLTVGGPKPEDTDSDGDP
jgi:elongation factor 3